MKNYESLLVALASTRLVFSLITLSKRIHTCRHQPRIYRSLQPDMRTDLLRSMSARWCTCLLETGIVGILGRHICLWTGAVIKDVRCNPHGSRVGRWQPFWVKSSGSDAFWSMCELLFEPPLDSSFSPISKRALAHSERRRSQFS